MEIYKKKRKKIVSNQGTLGSGEGEERGIKTQLYIYIILTNRVNQNLWFLVNKRYMHFAPINLKNFNYIMIMTS